MPGLRRKSPDNVLLPAGSLRQRASILLRVPLEDIEAAVSRPRFAMAIDAMRRGECTLRRIRRRIRKNQGIRESGSAREKGTGSAFFEAKIWL
jgi:DNA helicase TIP49 (TBP-interacting protein)